MGDHPAIGAQQHRHHHCSFELVIFHQQAGTASVVAGQCRLIQVNVATLELKPGNPPLERPQLKPLAGGRRPGGSSGTSIVEPSSIG